MTFQENLREFLDIEQGFASEALILSTLGGEYYISGVFSCDYFEANNGGIGPAVSGDRPIFECIEEDIKDIRYGDYLKVNNKRYRICSIKPDGSGFVSLILEEQN